MKNAATKTCHPESRDCGIEGPRRRSIDAPRGSSTSLRFARNDHHAMRRYSQRHSLSTLSEINITPLLDLAFVLLIIFMITTPLLENSVNLVIPSSSARTILPATVECSKAKGSPPLARIIESSMCGNSSK